MNKDNRSKMIITITTIVLLIAVIITSIVLYINNKKQDREFEVTFKQLYVTENNLIHLVDNYFYENSQDEKYIIDVTKQKEISVDDFNYEKIYPTKDDKYILYSNDNDNFKCYIFNGESIKELYKVDNKQLQPLLITENNKTYILGFYSIDNNELTLYDLTTGTIKSIPNTISIIVTNENYYIIENKDHKYGVIDKEGNSFIPTSYLDVEITDDLNFILKNNKNQYGILDKNQSIILTFKYTYITKEQEYYLTAQNEKMSLLDNELNTIIDGKMNYNTTNPTNNIELFKTNNNIIVVNNKDEELKGYDYKYHNMYIINNKKIKEDIKETDVFSDGESIYYLDNKKIYIINQKNEKRQFKVDAPVINVTQKMNGLYEITFLKEKETTYKKYYNENLEELSIENEIIYIKDKAIGYIEEKNDNDIFKIVDVNNNTIKDIKGKQIYLYEDYLIVDNAIYQIIIK